MLQRAARAGIVVAGAPLAGWLAACADAGVAPRPSLTPRPSPSPTEAPTATPTQEPAATPDARPVTIAITGDVMLGRSVGDRILATGDRFPFNDTADFLHDFDLTVGNLECVVSRQGQPVPNKPYHFRADPTCYGRLNAAGFDVVSLANNHSGDFGTAAFADMLAALPDHGIAPLGAGMNLTAAHQPVIRTVRATTVGFLAYCEIVPMSFAATATSPGHAWLDTALMRADIAALRQHVDFLVVFMHWGLEYVTRDTAAQQATARRAVEAGADVVVGSHPHVIQPSETYAGKPIVYSLGNFVFDEMYEDAVRRGNVLTLTVQGAQLLDWKLRPSYIAGNDGAPRWA
ncbi:MAG TPA: CapA family protein [Candidatus Dormibacteraeota bacterium]|nr:CapA family protein [Candidatus Dormibacteraeota bacterium]